MMRVSVLLAAVLLLPLPAKAVSTWYYVAIFEGNRHEFRFETEEECDSSETLMRDAGAHIVSSCGLG